MIDFGQALHPDGARLLVEMFDRSALLHDFIGAHRCIADEHQLIVGAELVEHVHRRRSGGEAAAVVLPHALIGAVVEIEELQMLELAGGGGEPFLAQPRSEEHTSELQSLMRISYAVFCLKKK